MTISPSYLNAGREIVEISTESIVIYPEVLSIILNKADMIELFPAPVLPTIPTFSHGLVSNDTFFKQGTK